MPLTTGALIGVARLVGVVVYRQFGRMTQPAFFMERGRGAILDPISDDLADRIRPWWRGPWGWLWSNEPGEEPLLLPEPIPMRGQQGLWRLPTIPWGRDGEASVSGMWALEQWRKARETR